MTESLIKTSRISAVDALRGLALTGVVFANFNSYSEQQVPPSILDSISDKTDVALMHFNSVFLEWKFFCLFAVLFGYGFGLILESVKKQGVNPVPFFIRRMLWLFLIGVIHTALWTGDVLHLYARSGLILLLFRKAKPRTLLIVSLLMMFGTPLIYGYATRNFADFFGTDQIGQLFQALKYGKLNDVISANWTAYRQMFLYSWSDLHDLVETLGRFLFGYWLMKSGFFSELHSKTKFLKSIVGLTLIPTLAYWWLNWARLTEYFTPESFLWAPVFKIGIFCNTLLYASLFLLIYIRNSQSTTMKLLTNAGKMTLTNYLIVSTIMIVSLYGIGFGCIGDIPIKSIWTGACISFLLLLLFSNYWMTRYRYGPAEWIWRQLTWMKRIPIKKAIDTEAKRTDLY